jgi:predicted dehydrogenase
MMPSSNSQKTDADRRTFVKKGLAAGSILGAVTLNSRMAHAASGSEIRVGLIGCGGRGRGAAENAMNADTNVRIVGLADLYDSSIKACRESLSKKNVTQFTVEDDRCFVGLDSYKKLLATDIDVVLIAAPPFYRPEHFEAAVRAGKQIFCEKPIATDVVGVRRVESACKDADSKGLNVVSGLCWRYDELMLDMMKRVHDGAVGDIVTIQSNYLTNPVWSKERKPGESEIEYQMRNWMNYVWLSGDHIVEQFIHSLDKALWLNHDVPPARAYGLGGRLTRNDETEGDIYDHFSVIYEWENGRRCFAHTRQMQDCFNQTDDFVFGTEGKATMCKGIIEGKNPYKHSGEGVQMHQAEQNEFFKAVRGERPRINNGDYMCKSTMMAILGREACYTGKVISYDDLAKSNLDLSPASFDAADAPKVIVRKPGQYHLDLGKS